MCVILLQTFWKAIENSRFYGHFEAVFGKYDQRVQLFHINSMQM